MPDRIELDQIYLSLDSQNAPPLVKAGRWYCNVVRHERLPSRVTPQDYDRWRRIGLQKIIQSVAVLTLAATAAVLPIRCAYNRAQAECKDYTMQDFGNNADEAFNHTRGVLVTLHGYKSEELYDVYQEDGTIHTCAYGTIQRLDNIAHDFRTGAGDYRITTTTTLPG